MGDTAQLIPYSGICSWKWKKKRGQAGKQVESEPFREREGRKSVSTLSEIGLDSNRTLLKFCHAHRAKSPLRGNIAKLGLGFQKKSSTSTALLQIPHLPL